MTHLRDRKNHLSFVTNSTARYRGREREIVMEAFPEYAAVRMLGTRTGAPDEMDAFAQLLPSEQGRRLKIDVFYCGDPWIGNDLVVPLRALKPTEDSIKVKQISPDRPL
jgi:hypothetical protein